MKKKINPATVNPKEETRGILLTREQVADLFRVSPATVSNWIVDGRIRKAAPGKFFLRDIAEYYVRLNVASPAVHDSKRLEKTDAEIQKVKAETALREQEARMLAREELKQIAPTDAAMVQLYGKLLRRFSQEAIRVLAMELAGLFRQLPGSKHLTDTEVAELAIAWAQMYADKLATYALSDDLYSYQKSRLWADCGENEAASSDVMLFDAPVWVPSSVIHGERKEGSWWRTVPNPAYADLPETVLNPEYTGKNGEQRVIPNPAYETMRQPRFKSVQVEGPPPEQSILEVVLRNKKGELHNGKT